MLGRPIWLWCLSALTWNSAHTELQVANTFYRACECLCEEICKGESDARFLFHRFFPKERSCLSDQHPNSIKDGLLYVMPSRHLAHACGHGRLVCSNVHYSSTRTGRFGSNTWKELPPKVPVQFVLFKDWKSLSVTSTFSIIVWPGWSGGTDWEWKDHTPDGPVSDVWAVIWQVWCRTMPIPCIRMVQDKERRVQQFILPAIPCIRMVQDKERRVTYTSNEYWIYQYINVNEGSACHCTLNSFAMPEFFMPRVFIILGWPPDRVNLWQTYVIFVFSVPEIFLKCNHLWNVGKG